MRPRRDRRGHGNRKTKPGFVTIPRPLRRSSCPGASDGCCCQPRVLMHRDGAVPGARRQRQRHGDVDHPTLDGLGRCCATLPCSPSLSTCCCSSGTRPMRSGSACTRSASVAAASRLSPTTRGRRDRSAAIGPSFRAGKDHPHPSAHGPKDRPGLPRLRARRGQRQRPAADPDGNGPGKLADENLNVLYHI